jgi:glucan phosphoethanolaminetransferase (alkaline phosphatase superfamily)
MTEAMEDEVLALNVWRSFPPRVKRVITVMLFFLLSIGVTATGVSAPLSREKASKINEESKEVQDYVLTVDMFRGVTLIFGNNFALCLSFFAPVVGVLFGLYVLYSTGVVIAAQSIVKGVNPHLAFTLLFIMPFAWLEFLAYSAAFAENVWLTWRIIKRDWRRELVNACMMISLCALMLLAAAFIEMAMIKAFAGGFLNAYL